MATYQGVSAGPTAITAVSTGVSILCGDRETVGIRVSGTFTATLTPQISTDDGTTWTAVLGGIWNKATATVADTITAAGQYEALHVAGGCQWRLFCTSYTSSPTVALRAVRTRSNVVAVASMPTGASANQVQGTAADGAPAVGNPIQMGGVDGSGNAQAILVDTAGMVQVVGAVAHDGVSSGNPVLEGGYASATAPSDVSADGDVVRGWNLRNGSRSVYNAYAFDPSNDAVRPYPDYVSLTPALATTGAYIAGDCIGGKIDLVMPAVTPVDLPTGSPISLVSFMLTDALNQKVALQVLFFSVASASLTAGTYTDNGALVLSTDNAFLCGFLDILATDWKTIGTAAAVNAVVDFGFTGDGKVMTPAASTICMVIVANGSAPTYGSNSISLFPRARFKRGI